MTIKGFPVVIVDSLGVPVTPVFKGAPLASVANNGFGSPITLTAKGTPMVVDGIDPPTPPTIQDLAFWSTGTGTTELITDSISVRPYIMVLIAFQSNVELSGVIVSKGSTALGLVVSKRNEDANLTTAIYYGQASGTAAIKIESSTGFDGLYGQTVEFDDAVSVIWSDSYTGTDEEITLSGTGVGLVFSIGATPTPLNKQMIFTPGGVLVSSSEFISGPLLDITNPTVLGPNWTLSGTKYTHADSGTEARDVMGTFTINEVVTPAFVMSSVHSLEKPPSYSKFNFMASYAGGGSGFGFSNTYTKRFDVERIGISSNLTDIKADAVGKFSIWDMEFRKDYNASYARAASWLQTDTTMTQNITSAQITVVAACVIPAGPSGFDWTTFSVTTGDSGDWIGYSNGDIISPPFNPPVGSITNEPTSLTELEALFQDSSGDIVVVFQGDWRTQMDAITLTFDSQVLSYQGSSLQGGNTFLRFSGYSGTLTVNTAYQVVFE